MPTLQGPCYPSQKWRGTLTLLPQSEIRSSSIAPVPVKFREAPLNSTVSLTSQRNPAKLPEVMGTSRGNPGFPATPRERPREFFFEASWGLIPLPWLESNEALPLATSMETWLPWHHRSLESLNLNNPLNPFNILCIWFANILLRIFVSIFSSDTCL